MAFNIFGTHHLKPDESHDSPVSNAVAAAYDCHQRSVESVKRDGVGAQVATALALQGILALLIEQAIAHQKVDAPTPLDWTRHDAAVAQLRALADGFNVGEGKHEAR